MAESDEISETDQAPEGSEAPKTESAPGLDSPPVGIQERVDALLERLEPADRGTGSCVALLRSLPRGDDELWLWCLTEGVASSERLRAILPELPPPAIQERYTALSGRDTFRQAFGFKQTCLEQAPELDAATLDHARVLDFGCGWGRISLALLNQVDPERLSGADVLAEAIADCRERGMPIRLEQIEPLPPTVLDSGSFDLVLSYSVFSHLAERHFLAWMNEMYRLLRPGGRAFVTTRPREAIQWFEDLRHSGEIADYARGAASSFEDAEAAFATYDAGEFCFDPAGSGGDGLVGFYGEACVSLEYARRQLGSLFSHIDMVRFDQHHRFDQNLLVLTR